MTHDEEHCHCSPFKNTAWSIHLDAMLVRNHAASSHRLWRPCSHRRGRHERKMPFMQYFFLCCGYVSYTKYVKDVARSNKFLFVCSHQDPLMIDWYHEGLNLWPCLNPSLEPGWLGNWSHKDTATPQHWLFSRQGTVRSMLIPCRPTAYTVPRRACRSDQQREDRA